MTQRPQPHWMVPILVALVLALLVAWLGLNDWRFPFAASPLHAQPPAASGEVPNGTYHGLATQVSAHTKTWKVTITFTFEVGAIRYDSDSSPSCTGTLTRQPDGIWVERITEGRCDTAGSWRFAQVTATHVRGDYQPADGSYTVTADLTAA